MFHKFSRFLGHRFLHRFVITSSMENEPKNYKHLVSWTSLFATFSGHRFFTLRAYPPTRLHAPYLHAPEYSRSVLTDAMRMLTPWDPGLGTRDPRKGPSQGPRGPFGPPGQGRLRRPWGPWGPLGLFRGYSEWVLFCGKLLWGCICKVRSKQPIWK